MKRKVILCSFIPLGLILVLAAAVLVVKNSKWASQKCEESIGYASVGYEIGNSLPDDGDMTDHNEFTTGSYFYEDQFVEFHLDSASIDGGCIKLVIAYVGEDENAFEQIFEQMPNNTQYTIVDEYEIDSTGQYVFEAHNIVEGWYRISVISGDDVARASGNLTICTYLNNWNNLIDDFCR